MTARISRSPPESPTLCIAEPELRISRHALADDMSMFRFDGSQKEFLGGAMFFPVHGSEQRHAAYCNHRPCRGLGNGPDGKCQGAVQPRDEAGVKGSRREIVFANST